VQAKALLDAQEDSRTRELDSGTGQVKVTDVEPDELQAPLQHAFPLRRSTRVRDAPDRRRHDYHGSDSDESSGDESIPLAERVKAAATHMKLSNRAGIQPSELDQQYRPAAINDTSSRPQRQKLRPDRLGFDRTTAASGEWSQADDSSSTGSQTKPSSSHHSAEQPERNAVTKKTRIRGKFVRRPIPSLRDQGGHIEEAVDGWSSLLVRQLREAFVQVDPTSVTFWDDVAVLLPRSGKTASECRDKWFSLVKTPQAAGRFAPKSRVAYPVIQPPNVAEDDLFNSTPMRSESQNQFNEEHPLVKHLPADQDPPSVAADMSSVAVGERAIATDAQLRPPAAKPGFKSYLQGMRRDLNRSKKEASNRRSKKAVAASKPKSMALRETFQDDDLKLKVQLSPGGTMQINNMQADGDEEDDFWNLHEDEECE
jgi:hypothetical protein